MNELVKINITANHKMADTNEKHKIIESYDGKYYIKGDAHYILYDSYDEDSKEKISNTIKYSNGQLSIVRKGNTKSTMIFTSGKKHKSDYVTPFGTFAFMTDTDRLKVELTSEFMEIDLTYLLYLNDAFYSNCEMSINIEQVTM